MNPLTREELREKLIEKYMEVAWTFYFEGSEEQTERKENAPKFADALLSLFDTTGFATYTGETISLCDNCPQFKRHGQWQISQCSNCQKLNDPKQPTNGDQVKGQK